jgi:poly(3-hydroxybutyrate) depolymerase
MIARPYELLALAALVQALHGCDSTSESSSPARGGSKGSGGGGRAGTSSGGSAGFAAQGGSRGGSDAGDVERADTGAIDMDAGSSETGAADSGPLDASVSDAALADAASEGAPIQPPAAVGCVTDVAPGLHEFACDTTTHVVSVPERCVTTACGVIVDVHGGSMSADMEDKNTNLRALGKQFGYIVIQPNALPNAFLAGARTFVAGEDDVRVLNILMDVTRAFHADMKRIHMTGFSEGGYMTWRWICKHSELLASAAPAAAGWQCTTLPITVEVACQFAGSDVPARQIPILYMQGMKDNLVSPSCVVSWLEGNVFPVLRLGQGSVTASDAGFQRTRYESPERIAFEFIQHQYSTDAQFFGVAIGGHCYPGSTDFTPSLPGQLMGFGCKDQVSFNWGEEVVRFFVQNPKK